MSNDKKIIITYGSLLKDHPDVMKQAKKYPTLDVSLWWDDKTFVQTLPEFFDGRDVWEGSLCYSVIQRCEDSWAIVAKNVLADRFILETDGQIALQLSETEIIACINVPPKSHIDGVLSSTSLDYVDSCQGYSIYDAWEYIYAFGVPENNCFSHKKLENLKPIIPLPERLTFLEKAEAYGLQCKNIEDFQTKCIWEKNGKPVARRSFYASGIVNISQYDEKGVFLLEKTIEAIKYELLRFGPVAAGFLIYENFANDYDGTTIYEKVSGKPLGGNYVTIIGWNKDKKTGVEYWICRNTYGSEWGLVGFFYIKIGIKECMLEENVSAPLPYFYDLNKYKNTIEYMLNGKKVDITDMKTINPSLYEQRVKLDVDYNTFYSKNILKKIKEGKLYGDLHPLIENPDLLIPNQRFYWVRDFKNFKFIEMQMDKQKEKEKLNGKNGENHYFWKIVYIIVCIFVFYVGFKGNFFKIKK